MDPWDDLDREKRRSQGNSHNPGTTEWRSLWKKLAGKGDDLGNDIGLGFKGHGKTWTWILVMVMLVGYACSGLYIVDPDERAVEQLFGRYTNTQSPGLRFWWPNPIGTVTKVRVETVNKESLGTLYEGTRGGVATDGIMLTGDENIVNVSFDVHWKVSDVYSFLFNIREDGQGSTVRNAAESAIREVVGMGTLGDALEGEGRYRIAVQVRNLVQKILDGYGAGIEVLSIQLRKVDPPHKVISAFRDVQSARADKERMINEAHAYKNEVLPKAKGSAIQLKLDAEGYKSEVVNRAVGETSKYEAIRKEYVNSPASVRRRMYLETMESVLSSMEKTVVTGKMEGMISYLPMVGDWKNSEKKGSGEK